jgi:hypothetical protein
MTANINKGFEQLKGTLESEQFKKILPYLLIGGAGAAGGAALTGGRRSKRGESRLGYMGRVLRNALVTGGLAAGATGLARYGMDKLNNPAASADGKQTPDLANPTDQALRSTLFSPTTAAASGALGLGLTHKLPGIGADTAARDSVLDDIAKQLGGRSRQEVLNMKPSLLKSEMSASVDNYKKQLQNFIKNPGKGKSSPPIQPFINGIDETARAAGLTVGSVPSGAPFADLQLRKTLTSILKSPKGAKGEAMQMLDRLKNSPLGDAAINTYKHPTNILDELRTLKSDPSLEGARQIGSRLTRRGLMSTFGQTGGRRALRAGVGLTAAAIPALIGAFVTDEKKDY